jgi:type II secretory ATPase GspE/PulE/Tfp pilus assembly ATPase PilB-like protein
MRLSEADRRRIEGFLKEPHGLMVVSGPAGSGKTSTMLACASLLVGEETKVVTIEDPVAVRIPGMTQVQVNKDAGLTYETGIRALMRMDPDVLVIGELLDPEVLRQALNASLTGHLVFSQMHVSSAAGTLRRFLDMGADPALLGDAVSLIVGQRLVRLLCTQCRKQQRPSEAAIERARAWAGPLAHAIVFDRFYTPQGCPKCGTTGYQGRAAMVETLAMTPDIAADLRRSASTHEIEATAIRGGMTTLAADGLRRCQLGETSLEEVTRVLAMG